VENDISRIKKMYRNIYCIILEAHFQFESLASVIRKLIYCSRRSAINRVRLWREIHSRDDCSSYKEIRRVVHRDSDNDDYLQ